MAKKLFIDIGVGYRNTEAWGRKKEFIIIGFEPANKRYNDIKDSYPGELFNWVVSDRDGEIEVWEHPMSGILLFIRSYPHHKRVFKKVKKKTIKLDSLDWKNFDEIHIWADIEGSELLMLKGATEMLASGKVKWINLEMRKVSPAEGWVSAKGVYEFLDKCGFKPDVLLDQLPYDKEKFENEKDVIFIQKG